MFQFDLCLLFYFISIATVCSGHHVMLAEGSSGYKLAHHQMPYSLMKLVYDKNDPFGAKYPSDRGSKVYMNDYMQPSPDVDQEDEGEEEEEEASLGYDPDYRPDVQGVDQLSLDTFINKLGKPEAMAKTSPKMGVTDAGLLRLESNVSQSGECVVTPDCPSRLATVRSIDGSCNNLDHPDWGHAGLPYLRLLRKKMNMESCGLKRRDLPRARVASLALVRRADNDLHQTASMFVMVWGQVIDHDIEVTPPRQMESGELLDCCDPVNFRSAHCCPILTPGFDPFYGRQRRPVCIPLLRSLLGLPVIRSDGLCPPGGPDVVNMNTAFIDGSFLYGSDSSRTSMLRVGTGGKLKSSLDRRGRHFPPISTSRGLQMEFGDSRGDVHPPFTLVTTLFLRQHNAIAASLAELNPKWDDQRLFDEARKINIGIIQHVTYTQFLASLLGSSGSDLLHTHTTPAGYEDIYKADVNPTISMVFATAGFRLHSLVPEAFILRDAQYRVRGGMRLRDIFHKPLRLVAGTNFDDLVRGLVAQPLRKFNNIYTGEMTEWLFPEAASNFGMDIVALNIQRGRDHALPGYTQYMKLCRLIKDETTWASIRPYVRRDLFDRLVRLYRRPDDVDPYVGFNMESPVVGLNRLDTSILGPTAHCIVRDQFFRLRAGDRFFYSNRNHFTSNQLAQVKKMTLARLICDNADNIESLVLPVNIFRLPDKTSNPLVSCLDFAALPKMDLGPWRETLDETP